MAAQSSAETKRLVIAVGGAVQGVGFRPFVFRLASELGLSGWVNNGPAGVAIEAEGSAERLQELLERLLREAPPQAVLGAVEQRFAEPVGYVGFAIRPSELAGERSALVLPDLATCEACLRELRTPGDRRYRYAFTNCTACGPRFSIVEALPYDRAATTMRTFQQCRVCQAEYDDPRDRRFHAQPNACPRCGPEVELRDRGGRVRSRAHAALVDAAAALAEGAIVAVKGLGGFQLLVLARDAAAVGRLRARKRRDEKSLALMVPNLEAAAALADVGEVEARLLRSAAAPIVLLRRRAVAAVAVEVAPDSPNLGLMLPCTPLHHLLLAEVGHAVVATSGNLSDEPICIDEREALVRLGAIADLFVVHDRPIARPVDDSVTRVVAGRPMVLRRARGFAPLPIELPGAGANVLALGGHLKNTVAVSVGAMAFGSQHVGDLETELATRVFEAAAADLPRLYGVAPSLVACDAHPDYRSTRYAEATGLPIVRVQHHHAHVRACMLDNRLEGPVLGVSWDGAGLGADGSIWGGELLVVDDRAEPCWRRVGHLRTFGLPGGDAAARQPWRSALGVLHELLGDALFDAPLYAELCPLPAPDRRLFRTALARGLHTPRTSSAGRLFDAASAIVGLATRSSYEGQAAMRLEAAVGPDVHDGYPLAPCPDAGGRLVLDWGPLFEALLADRTAGVPVGAIAARFHRGLARGIAASAAALGLERVLLTGGCFQNACLLEESVEALRARGLRPYWHERIPPGDGGIAFGQLGAAVAAAPSRESER